MTLPTLTASTAEKLARRTAAAEKSRAKLVVAVVALRADFAAQLAENPAPSAEERAQADEILGRLAAVEDVLATETSAEWWATVGEVRGDAARAADDLAELVMEGDSAWWQHAKPAARAAWTARYA